MFFPDVNMRYVTFCFWHYCSEQRWVKIKSGQPAQQIPHLTTLWQPCTKCTFVWSGIQRAKHVQRQSNPCLLSRWIVGCPCRSCSETYWSYKIMDLLSLSLWKNSLFCTVEASGVWYWSVIPLLIRCFSDSGELKFSYFHTVDIFHVYNDLNPKQSISSAHTRHSVNKGNLYETHRLVVM
jgi:hypothetical protein